MGSNEQCDFHRLLPKNTQTFPFRKLLHGYANILLMFISRNRSQTATGLRRGPSPELLVQTARRWPRPRRAGADRRGQTGEELQCRHGSTSPVDAPACTKEQETMRTQRSHNTCCNSSVEEALVVCAANCVKYIPAYLLSGLVFEWHHFKVYPSHRKVFWCSIKQICIIYFQMHRK